MTFSPAPGLAPDSPPPAMHTRPPLLWGSGCVAGHEASAAIPPLGAERAQKEGLKSECPALPSHGASLT